MSIHEPGHDDGIRGVHHLGVPGPDLRAHLGHDPVFDQHIGLGEVGGLGSEREDAAPAEEGSSRQLGLPAPAASRPVGPESITPPSCERPSLFSNTTHPLRRLPECWAFLPANHHAGSSHPLSSAH